MLNLNYVITCKRCMFRAILDTDDRPPRDSEIIVQSDGEAVAAGWQRRLVGAYVYDRRDYEYSDKMMGWVCPECAQELDSQASA